MFTYLKQFKYFTLFFKIQRYVDHMQETMPISPEAVKLLMKRGSKKSGNGFVYTHDARMVLKK